MVTMVILMMLVVEQIELFRDISLSEKNDITFVDKVSVADPTADITFAIPDKLPPGPGYVLYYGKESVQEVNEVSEELSVIWQNKIIQIGHDGTKTVTTTRVRITTLTFEWMGQRRTIEDRKVLWSKTRNLVKREEWVEE